MSKIIDLDLLVPENISFKIGGEIYEVPASFDTQTVAVLMQAEQKTLETNDQIEVLNIIDEMVHMLLSQLNDVTLEWVKKLHATQKNAIFHFYKQRMYEIDKNPNYASLQSQ